MQVLRRSLAHPSQSRAVLVAKKQACFSSGRMSCPVLVPKSTTQVQTIYVTGAQTSTAPSAFAFSFPSMSAATAVPVQNHSLESQHTFIVIIAIKFIACRVLQCLLAKQWNVGMLISTFILVNLMLAFLLAILEAHEQFPLSTSPLSTIYGIAITMALCRRTSIAALESNMMNLLRCTMEQRIPTMVLLVKRFANTRSLSAPSLQNSSWYVRMMVALCFLQWSALALSHPTDMPQYVFVFSLGLVMFLRMGTWHKVHLQRLSSMWRIYMRTRWQFLSLAIRELKIRVLSYPRKRKVLQTLPLLLLGPWLKFLCFSAGLSLLNKTACLCVFGGKLSPTVPSLQVRVSEVLIHSPLALNGVAAYGWQCLQTSFRCILIMTLQAHSLAIRDLKTRVTLPLRSGVSRTLRPTTRLLFLCSWLDKVCFSAGLSIVNKPPKAPVCLSICCWQQVGDHSACIQKVEASVALPSYFQWCRITVAANKFQWLAIGTRCHYLVAAAERYAFPSRLKLQCCTFTLPFLFFFFTRWPMLYPQLVERNSSYWSFLVHRCSSQVWQWHAWQPISPLKQVRMGTVCVTRCITDQHILDEVHYVHLLPARRRQTITQSVTSRETPHIHLGIILLLIALASFCASASAFPSLPCLRPRIWCPCKALCTSLGSTSLAWEAPSSHLGCPPYGTSSRTQFSNKTTPPTQCPPPPTLLSLTPQQNHSSCQGLAHQHVRAPNHSANNGGASPGGGSAPPQRALSGCTEQSMLFLSFSHLLPSFAATYAVQLQRWCWSVAPYVPRPPGPCLWFWDSLHCDVYWVHLGRSMTLMSWFALLPFFGEGTYVAFPVIPLSGAHTPSTSPCSRPGQRGISTLTCLLLQMSPTSMGCANCGITTLVYGTATRFSITLSRITSFLACFGPLPYSAVSWLVNLCLAWFLPLLTLHSFFSCSTLVCGHSLCFSTFLAAKHVPLPHYCASSFGLCSLFSAFFIGSFTTFSVYPRKGLITFMAFFPPLISLCVRFKKLQLPVSPHRREKNWPRTSKWPLISSRNVHSLQHVHSPPRLPGISTPLCYRKRLNVSKLLAFTLLARGLPSVQAHTTTQVCRSSDDLGMHTAFMPSMPLSPCPPQGCGSFTMPHPHLHNVSLFASSFCPSPKPAVAITNPGVLVLVRVPSHDTQPPLVAKMVHLPLVIVIYTTLMALCLHWWVSPHYFAQPCYSCVPVFGIGWSAWWCCHPCTPHEVKAISACALGWWLLRNKFLIPQHLCTCTLPFSSGWHPQALLLSLGFWRLCPVGLNTPLLYPFFSFQPLECIGL